MAYTPINTDVVPSEFYTDCKFNLGASVAVSADGKTALVSGPGYQAVVWEVVGAVWVYNYNGTNWARSARILPTGYQSSSYGNQFGISCALSADGTTAIIGASSDYYGIARIYVLSGGVWTEQGRIAPTTFGSNFAQSVSLSADGNTALVGAPLSRSAAGSALVYTRTAGVWTLQQSQLICTGSPNQAGSKVALSADGKTAILSSEYDNSATGAFWVWVSSAGVWTQQGPKYVATGMASSYPHMGSSMAVSADGNTVALGAYYDNNYHGSGVVFTRDAGGVWTQQANIIPSGLYTTGYFGMSCSLSADGNTAVFGAPSDSAFYTYSRAGSVWTQTGRNSTSVGLGKSIALSANASMLVGGGGNGSDGSSSFYSDPSKLATNLVFTDTAAVITGTSPSPVISTIRVAAVIIAAAMGVFHADPPVVIASHSSAVPVSAASAMFISPSPAIRTKFIQVGTSLFSFASALAISDDGNTALVGDSSSAGAVSLCTFSDNRWTPQGNSLTPTFSGLETDGFSAHSVSLSQDCKTALVGYPGSRNYYGTASGLCRVFTLSGSTWTQQGTALKPSDAGAGYQVGVSVSLSDDGNTALVRGSSDVWIFTRSAGVWTQNATTFTVSSGSAASLSGDGNTALIGGETDNGNVGAAWVYTRSGSVWTLQGSKLVPSDRSGSTPNIGASVSLSTDGNTALIGAYNDGPAGAAWIYTRTGGVWSNLAKMIAPSGSPVTFGGSVSQSSNGKMALIGVKLNAVDPGAAYICSKIGTTWGIESTALLPAGSFAFGAPLALSGDARTAVMIGGGKIWTFVSGESGNVNTNIESVSAPAVFSAPSPAVVTVRHTEMFPSPATGSFTSPAPEVVGLSTTKIGTSATPATGSFTAVSPSIAVEKSIQSVVSAGAGVFTSPSPSIAAARSTSTSVVAGTSVFTSISPVIAAEMSCSTPVLSATGTFTLLSPSATGQIHSSSQAQTCVGTFASPSPLVTATIANQSSANPTAASAVFSCRSPAITTVRFAPLSATAAVGSFTVPSPTVTCQVFLSLSATPATAVFTSLTPYVNTQIGALVPPASAHSTFTVPSPGASAVRNAVVSATTAIASFTVPIPSSGAGVSVNLPASPANSVFTAPNPVVNSKRSATTSVIAAAGTFTVPPATVSTIKIDSSRGSAKIGCSAIYLCEIGDAGLYTITAGDYPLFHVTIGDTL